MASQSIFSKIELIKHPQPGAELAPMLLTTPGLSWAALLGSDGGARGDTGGRTANSSALVRGARFSPLTVPIPLPHTGEKTYEFQVPAGMQVDMAQAIALPESSNGAAVTLLPGLNVGGTGTQSLKIWFSVPPGGHLRLRVRAYATPIPSPSTGDSQEDEVEVLYLRNYESINRMVSFMASRKRVVVLVDSSLNGDIFKLAGTGFFGDCTWKLSMGPSGPRIKINPTWEWVVIVGIIAAALVGALMIAFLTAMVIHGINHCYKINVGSIALGEITIGGQTIALALPTMTFDLEPTECS